VCFMLFFFMFTIVRCVFFSFSFVFFSFPFTVCVLLFAAVVAK